MEQELQSGVENFSHPEAGAVVVIESEPSASAVSTHYEQRDGRWVGEVDGTERELSMPDEQLLNTVLAMEIGAPPIINTADATNLAGEPVTWVAQYERTASGITTTFDEIPRSILQVDANESLYIQEDYDLEPANQNSAFESPGRSLSAEPIFTPSLATRTQESTGSKMWFENSPSATAPENKGADVIDFFTGSELFEPAPQAVQAEAIRDVQNQETSSESGSFNVFTGLVETESQIDTLVDGETPVSSPETIANSIAELTIGSVDHNSDDERDLPTAQSAAATSSLEIRYDLAETEVIESVPDIAVLEASSENLLQVDVLQPVAEEVFIDHQIKAAAEPTSEFATVQNVLEQTVEPALIGESNVRESNIVTEIQDDHQSESYISEVPEVGQITAEPQITVAKAPVQENIEDILLATQESELPVKQVASPEFSYEGPVISSVEKLGETVAHEELVTPAASHQDAAEATILPFENVIKINEDAETLVELPLDADSWASDFGSPLQAAPETESEVEVTPKSGIHISRHVSGLLDITVTIETETARTKTKKATKTMRAAA